MCFTNMQHSFGIVRSEDIIGGLSPQLAIPDNTSTSLFIEKKARSIPNGHCRSEYAPQLEQGLNKVSSSLCFFLRFC